MIYDLGMNDQSGWKGLQDTFSPETIRNTLRTKHSTHSLGSTGLEYDI
jgi:hypothetical protein